MQAKTINVGDILVLLRRINVVKIIKTLINDIVSVKVREIYFNK
jgi:hypothetical protein